MSGLHLGENNNQDNSCNSVSTNVTNNPFLIPDSYLTKPANVLMKSSNTNYFNMNGSVPSALGHKSNLLPELRDSSIA